jgi:putative transcriptional regulator
VLPLVPESHARRASLVKQERDPEISNELAHPQYNHVVLTVQDAKASEGESASGTVGGWAHALQTPETGCLLVAHEKTSDWWKHTVVLVLHHDDEKGSIGIILNRHTSRPLSVIVPELDCEQNAVLLACKVGIGGPMGTERNARCLVALSRIYIPGVTTEVVPGLWHVSNFEAVKETHAASLLLFVGYCGWTPGQLKNEVDAGAWYLGVASADTTLNLASSRIRGVAEPGTDAAAVLLDGASSTASSLHDLSDNNLSLPGSDLMGEAAWETVKCMIT